MNLEKFVIESTGSTPYVMLDHEAELLEISGRSFSTSSVEFYDQVTHVIETFFMSEHEYLKVDINLKHFNTSTCKCLFNLLNALKKHDNSETKNVVISWFYDEDNEDMRETGEDFMEVLDIELNLSAYAA